MPVVLTGAGAVAKQYSDALKSVGRDLFLDLTNKTSIAELGAIIQKCDNFISREYASCMCCRNASFESFL